MEVLARLALAQAARLARSGEYDAAEALLGEAVVSAGGPRAGVLDLKARIRAQQGRRAEAEALWREALALAPGDARIRDALAHIARASPGRRHLAGLAARLLAVVIVLALAGTVVAQRREIRRLAGAPPAPASLPDAAAGATPMPPSDATARPGAQLLDSIAAALAAFAEVEVVRLEREIEVRFPEPLFARGAAFRPGARDLVVRLARALAPFGGRAEARVVGHTDSVPVRAGAAYGSNLALGLARASRVAAMLLEAGAFGAGHTTVQSAADGSPPYEAATPAGALRNRTVTLRLAAAD